MSAESRRVAKTEVWVGWERQVVNGVYPLRRFLGGSNHSAVFLTEYRGASPSDVAIKLVPADSVETEAQLVQWGTAATLSHPHLISLFDVGRCHLGGRGFLFVVMEYAEQTLAQVLPQRALSPDEVRELLPPTLDTLAFLHRNQLVQGQLKPSNFLVINDQLKLAADTVRPAGIFGNSMARNSLYDPPELTDGEVSAAGDVWGLGVTMVEALTQRPLTWDDRLETASSHINLPAPFGDAVGRCLSRNPANRPSVVELANLCKPGPHPGVASAPQAPVHQGPVHQGPVHQASVHQASVHQASVHQASVHQASVHQASVHQASVHQASVRQASVRQASVRQASVRQAPAPEAPLAATEVDPSETSPKRSRLGPGIAAAIVISLAVWVGLRLRQQHVDAPRASSVAAQSDLESNAASDVSATAATSWPAAHATAASAAAPSPAAHATTAAASETLAAPNTRAAAATRVGASSAAAAIPVAAGAATGAGATTARSVQTRSDLSGTISRPLDPSSLPPESASPSVLHQVIPDVPEAIRYKIRGHVNVKVRVLVDPSGDVVGQFLESAGPSRYFARVAGDSVVGWKFAPADGAGPRVWLLRFEFTRDGATVDATAAQ